MIAAANRFFSAKIVFLSGFFVAMVVLVLNDQLAVVLIVITPWAAGIAGVSYRI